MTDVTAAVVAHVDRKARAHELRAFLAESYSTALHLDDGSLGCSGNH